MNIRRIVITGAAALAFMAGGAAVGAASDASPPTAAGAAAATPIKHVVVIYLENHSFDSIFGYWCNQNPGRCPDGGMPASVSLSDGSTVTPGVTPDKIPQVDHSVASQVAAMDGGKMDGWQNILFGQCDAATGYQCISGFQPSAIPNLTTLAGKFAISDDTFSMADSPSWGGHVYAVAATLDGFTGDNPTVPRLVTAGPGWGCDSNRVTPWIGPKGTLKQEPSCIPDPSLPLPNGGAFRATPVQPVPTIMDRLDAAHLGWRIYGATKAQATPIGRTGVSHGYGWSICPSFADCLDTTQDQNLVPSSGFQNAALNGALPAFSVVTPGGPTFTDSCHNGTSITACDDWVGSLVQSVETGPDWASTAIFITFDDFGGFYDGVPPPSTLNANGQQAGPRSPLIIVSPYARPGYTDTTPTTFAGILAYTEHTFGLAPLAANDAAAYDLNGAFNYSQPPLAPARMVDRPLPGWARRLAAHPPASLTHDPT
jgi:phospholipase C